MINFIGLRRFFAVISLIVLVPSLVALALWQLNPGIDFEGGLEIEVRFLQNVPQESVETALSDASLEASTVSTTREETFAITLPVPENFDTGQFETDVTDVLTAALGEFEQPELSTTDGVLETEIWFPASVTQDDVRDAMGAIDLSDARVQATGDSSFKIRAQEPDNATIETLRLAILASLEANVGQVFVLQSSSVSGILSSEIAKDAGIALAVAALAIVIYISIAFRRLPNPAVYGAAALIALLHDVTIVVGVFAILGEVADLEVNAMFVTALLAIIGYSVNDTIVVFDRVRETFISDPGAGLRDVVNAAVTQSLGRSLNTSITLILALLALVLIGGVTVRPFVLVLLTGAIAGTYSSIAVAAQVVVLWDESIRPRLSGEDAEDRRSRRERASA
jgi:preprotein translocase subunit SecF